MNKNLRLSDHIVLQIDQWQILQLKLIFLLHQSPASPLYIHEDAFSKQIPVKNQSDIEIERIGIF